MDKKETVVINGRRYDSVSGLPIDVPSEKHTTRQSLRTNTSKPAAETRQPRHAHSATQIHKKTQRSNTLNRKFIQKPAVTPQQPTQNSVAIVNKTLATTPAAPNITSSPGIKHTSGRRIDGMRPMSARTSSTRSRELLATSTKRNAIVHPATTQPLRTPVKPATEGPAAHPIITRAHSVQAQRKAAPAAKPQPTASIIKQAAINEALDNAPRHHAKQHKQTPRRSRLFSLASAFAALLLFAGYLTYLNVPNLSVRVAAAQAGIDASYPSYQPDGYKLNGPVAFSDGEVRMKFTANTGSTGFALTQSRSGWDSGALLENYVKEKSNGDYTTSQEKGITVYSYQGSAAWVSGGILYTIDGDAPLSPHQIRKIATSV